MAGELEKEAMRLLKELRKTLGKEASREVSELIRAEALLRLGRGGEAVKILRDVEMTMPAVSKARAAAERVPSAVPAAATVEGAWSPVAGITKQAHTARVGRYSLIAEESLLYPGKWDWSVADTVTGRAVASGVSAREMVAKSDAYGAATRALKGEAAAAEVAGVVTGAAPVRWTMTYDVHSFVFGYGIPFKIEVEALTLEEAVAKVKAHNSLAENIAGTSSAPAVVAPTLSPESMEALRYELRTQPRGWTLDQKAAPLVREGWTPDMLRSAGREDLAVEVSRQRVALGLSAEAAPLLPSAPVVAPRAAAPAILAPGVTLPPYLVGTEMEALMRREAPEVSARLSKANPSSLREQKAVEQRITDKVGSVTSASVTKSEVAASNRLRKETGLEWDGVNRVWRLAE